MESSAVSDLSPTMIAEHTFNSILQQIQNSNLNYQLQLTPLSSSISLKKTHIRDSAGTPIPLLGSIPGTYNASVVAALTARNLQITDELTMLKRDYADTIEDITVTHSRLIKLEKIAHSDVKHNEAFDRLQAAFMEVV